MDKIFITVAIIYGITVAAFGLYFNWLYAVENGFWAWLFFGELIASAKALVWPFFINW
jgi:hypothetical protein|tara:strand:- start:71 stop:244 length:174 start_codon:yes stop_codon:yes gene_type:complete